MDELASKSIESEKKTTETSSRTLDEGKVCELREEVWHQEVRAAYVNNNKIIIKPCVFSSENSMLGMNVVLNGWRVGGNGMKRKRCLIHCIRRVLKLLWQCIHCSSLENTFTWKQCILSIMTSLHSSRVLLQYFFLLRRHRCSVFVVKNMCEGFVPVMCVKRVV